MTTPARMALGALLLLAACSPAMYRVAGRPTRNFPVSWSGETSPEQTPAPAPSPVRPASAKAPLPPDARPLVPGLPRFSGRPARVAVLEFRARDVPQDALTLVSDEARSGALLALRGKPYVVMTRESMAAMLKDMGRSSTCDEGECEVETARNIGADVVVSGEVIKVEGVDFVTLKLHETATGSLLATRRCEGATLVDLVHNVGSTATALFLQ